MKDKSKKSTYSTTFGVDPIFFSKKMRISLFRYLNFGVLCIPTTTFGFDPLSLALSLLRNCRIII